MENIQQFIHILRQEFCLDTQDSKSYASGAPDKPERLQTQREEDSSRVELKREFTAPTTGPVLVPHYPVRIILEVQRQQTQPLLAADVVWE